MEIRDIDWQDVNPVADLLLEYYAEVGWCSLDVDRAKGLKQIASAITDEGQQLLIAVDKGEIIGLSWSHIVDTFFSDDIVIDNILVYVRKDKRGSMAGPRLIRHIKNWGKDLGAKVIKISTSSEINTARTIGLYKKMGYREVGSHFLMELS